MSIDINKIINESIDQTINSDSEVIYDNSNVEVQKVQDEHLTESNSEYDLVANSIAAGLGAMKTVKHMRYGSSMNEGWWEDEGGAEGWVKSAEKAGKGALKASKDVLKSGEDVLGKIGKKAGEAGEYVAKKADQAYEAAKGSPGVAAAGVGAGVGGALALKNLRKKRA